MPTSILLQQVRFVGPHKEENETAAGHAVPDSATVLDNGYLKFELVTPKAARSVEPYSECCRVPPEQWELIRF